MIENELIEKSHIVFVFVAMTVGYIMEDTLSTYTMRGWGTFIDSRLDNLFSLSVNWDVDSAFYCISRL